MIDTDVWRQGDVIYVQAPFERVDDCRSIPGGRYIPAYQTWQYAATPGTAGTIRSVFGETINTNPEFDVLSDHWETLTTKDIPPSPWPANLTIQTPWSHQADAYAFIQAALGSVTGSAGLFAGMGTGKTLVGTAVMAERYWNKVLIVSPVSMVETWKEAINVDTLGTYNALSLTGPIKKRAATMRNYEQSPNGSGVAFITNYEGAWQGELGEAILSYGFDAVILDEAQAIKSAGSKVSRFFDRLGRQVPFRLALTGTPAHDKVTDVYGIYRFLDPGIFGTSNDRFLEQYTTRRPISTGIMIVTGYINQEELSRKMYQIAFRVSEDVLDLPDAVDSTRSIVLSPRGLKAYKTMERDLVLQLDNGEDVIAGNVLTQILRLQQIAAGFLPVYDPEDPTRLTGYQEVDHGKRDALSELLQEIPEDEPVVVFAKFKRDLENIRDAVESSGRLYFEQSGRSNQWREWQGKPKGGDVIGVQIDAGSSGIDLTRSCHVIFYTLGYSLGDYEQARRRSLRPGQTRPVRYTHLLARGTVDEVILKALQDKKDMSSYVVDRLLNRA